MKVFPRLSETFVMNEIRALESLGEDVVVFSLHHPTEQVPHGLLRELRAPVCYVDDLPCSEASVGAAQRELCRRLGIPRADRGRYLPRKYVRLALGVAKLAAREKVSRLHAHFASRAAHVALLAARLAGYRFTFTAHAKDIYHEEVDPELLRWKIAEAEKVVTVSEYNAAYLRGLLPPGHPARAKIRRIYNGVDLGRFRSEIPASEAPPLVLGVGRLVEKKGFSVLVDACRLLREGAETFRCEIVGSGPEEDRLRRQIETGGLDGKVHLRGALPYERVVEAMRGARVVVLPAVVARDRNVDALPTVLLEAMAVGRPVVASRLSGIPEIVAEGETGFLVPPGDPEALAGCLSLLLRDPGKAAAMGCAGRRRAEGLFDLFGNVRFLRDTVFGASGEDS